MTATAISFSKNTVFVDAPPTGALAGRFDKLLPSPENDVAVTTPAMTAPFLSMESETPGTLNFMILESPMVTVLLSAPLLTV